jgi:hypothetical protein
MDATSLGMKGTAVSRSSHRSTPCPEKCNDVQVLLASVVSVGREGVCGNGICEVGELLPISSSGSIGQRCEADCPLEVIGCPQNDAGDVCSGKLLVLVIISWHSLLYDTDLVFVRG